MIHQIKLTEEQRKLLKKFANDNQHDDIRKVFQNIVAEYEQVILENKVDISFGTSCNLSRIEYSLGDVLRAELSILKFILDPSGRETKIVS